MMSVFVRDVTPARQLTTTTQLRARGQRPRVPAAQRPSVPGRFCPAPQYFGRAWVLPLVTSGRAQLFHPRMCPAPHPRSAQHTPRSRVATMPLEATRRGARGHGHKLHWRLLGEHYQKALVRGASRGSMRARPRRHALRRKPVRSRSACRVMLLCVCTRGRLDPFGFRMPFAAVSFRLLHPSRL